MRRTAGGWAPGNYNGTEQHDMSNDNGNDDNDNGSDRAILEHVLASLSRLQEELAALHARLTPSSQRAHASADIVVASVARVRAANPAALPSYLRALDAGADHADRRPRGLRRRARGRRSARLRADRAVRRGRADPHRARPGLHAMMIYNHKLKLVGSTPHWPSGGPVLVLRRVWGHPEEQLVWTKDDCRVVGPDQLVAGTRVRRGPHAWWPDGEDVRGTVAGHRPSPGYGDIPEVMVHWDSVRPGNQDCWSSVEALRKTWPDGCPYRYRHEVCEVEVVPA